MSVSRNREIDNLIFKVLENCSTDRDIEKLRDWFNSDPQATTYYCDFVKNYTAVLTKLDDMNELQDIPEADNMKKILWEKLAEQERESPALELEFPHDIELEETNTKPKKKKVDKLSLTAAICSAAALLVLAVNIILSDMSHYKVATITDMINAQWSAEEKIANDNRLVSTKVHKLVNGIVKIKTDKNVDLVVEAPAEFAFDSLTELKLNYGKVFVRVSPEGQGFAVNTENSRIVDLGTEFGVVSEAGGDTNVFMYKGKATVSAKGSDKSSDAVLLTEGEASRVDSSRQITEIKIENEAVVRNFDSKVNFIWRTDTINLADIVGGGNGFGNGRIESGINPTTGQAQHNLFNNEIAFGNSEYHTVDALKYVDGVFTPGFNGGVTQIASDSTVTAEFDQNSKCYWGYIMNGAFHDGVDVDRHLLVLNGKVCGTKENPSIYIHANQGITFDLDAIRRDMPDARLKEFTALAGISETVKEQGINPITANLPQEAIESGRLIYSRAEFTVLLDGEKVFNQKITDTEDAVEINIPLKADSRFLTLTTTEINGTIAYSWSLFDRPRSSLSFDITQ